MCGGHRQAGIAEGRVLTRESRKPHLLAFWGGAPSTQTMPTTAVQHVKRMRGGAQSHLMRCDDGHYYVVKFRNNPQHERVLANEFLATRLAERGGLPVAGGGGGGGARG